MGIRHPKVDGDITGSGVKKMDEADVIRSYEPNDRLDVLRISADTAVFGDLVVGYLTGCVDTISQRRRIIGRTILPLVGRILQGKYRLGGKTFIYAKYMVLGSLRKEFPHVDLKQNPAHLHINVESAVRGRGLGRSLMTAYLDQLREMGVPGVFLDTTDLNEAACRLYEAFGFELLDRRPIRVWVDVIDGPVENRVYGLRLVEDS